MHLNPSFTNMYTKFIAKFSTAHNSFFSYLFLWPMIIIIKQRGFQFLETVVWNYLPPRFPLTHPLLYKLQTVHWGIYKIQLSLFNKDPT